MSLYRSRDGTMIHTEGCRYAVREQRWWWAENQPWGRIAETIEAFGYRTCKVCDPFDEYLRQAAYGRRRRHLRLVVNR